MADRLTVGKSFAADLLARIPEDRRSAIQEILESPDGQPVIELLGDGALRQSDYSRTMNELSAYKTQLDDWFAQNKAALESAAAGQTRRVDPTAQPTPAGITRKELEDLVNTREQGVAAYIAAATGLALKHFKEFGESLDLTALLADPEVTKLGILGVYDRTFQTRYQEKAAAAETARVEAKVTERLAEERKKLGSTPPYPVSPHEPSPLDVLDTADGPAKFSPQAAADEYSALVARRLSQPA